MGVVLRGFFMVGGVENDTRCAQGDDIAIIEPTPFFLAEQMPADEGAHEAVVVGHSVQKRTVGFGRDPQDAVVTSHAGVARDDGDVHHGVFVASSDAVIAFAEAKLLPIAEYIFQHDDVAPTAINLPCHFLLAGSGLSCIRFARLAYQTDAHLMATIGAEQREDAARGSLAEGFATDGDGVVTLGTKDSFHEDLLCFDSIVEV